jgi:two-component system nitrogen regulation response regulator NtrX
MTTILVVDDEKGIREALAGVLKDEGYSVFLAATAEEALRRMVKRRPDLVLLDIWMPGKDGVEALGEIKERYPDLPVIMISGHANIETAVKTTKLGAYDFIEKPLSLEKVILTIEHALEQNRLSAENKELRTRELKRFNIIGKSAVIVAIQEDIKRAAPTNSWIMITGENGTGKEYLARNIHLYSERAPKPFVEVNCAAIPEELIESELFGHEKGAFTSAGAMKPGKFDIANGGTIFLDEIADMSLKTQAKVLRILQDQSFTRVGGTEPITVDVRVIAATNKNLQSEIESGNFREDLYYRLNVIPFHMPPLRDRAEDIELFISQYVAEFSARSSKEPPSVAADAMALLVKYRWPGNVRELRNLIERLVIMVPNTEICAKDLPPYISDADPSGTGSPYATAHLKEARNGFEREFIIVKLKEFNGNISKTASAIGIERSHLYRKIRSYGIEPE